MKDSLFSRYAYALFSLAKDTDNIDSFQKEIKEVKKIFDENSSLIELLNSEFIEAKERYKILDSIFKKKFSPLIVNFIKVLMKNHRLHAYPKIFYAFNSLCNEDKHILEGIVYSTYLLSNKELKDLNAAISKKRKIQVELINRLDPNLIGGIRVVVDNHIYDYSIQSELNELRNQLKA